MTDEDLDFVECPECGFDESDTSRGISMHFGYNHEGDIKNLFRCEECGRLRFGVGQRNTFCSKWCEVYSRVGTFKHSDEEYLRTNIEEEGLQPYEVAEEIGVEVGLVTKWIDKYGIGDEYECPWSGCERSFGTDRGMKQHHEQEHGESIGGYEYECEWCGDTFTSNHSPDSSNSPKYCDDDCFGASMEGENNPNKNTDKRQKLNLDASEVYSQEKFESVLNEDFEYTECPGCGRDDFKSSDGIKQHHAKAHGFSIKLPFRCKDCGLIKSGDDSDPKYCSECNWYEEGSEYKCPWDGCDRVFDTSNGRSVHHHQEHGESIAGYEYTCEHCGDEFESPIAPESDDAPKYCPPGDQSGESCESKDRTGVPREFTGEWNKEEWKKKISEGMVKAVAEGRAGSPLYPKQEIVEETDHEIDSQWEKEIDLILYESHFDFAYNSEDGFPTFDLGDSFYIPDFIVGDCVIEVKSSWTYGKRPEATEKRAKHLTEHDYWTYIVVGDVPELPCDAYVEYEADGDERIVEENRERFIETLEEEVSEAARSVFDC